MAEMPGLALLMRALALSGWTIWHAAWRLDDLDEDARRAVVARAAAAPTLLVAGSADFAWDGT